MLNEFSDKARESHVDLKSFPHIRGHFKTSGNDLNGLRGGRKEGFEMTSNKLFVALVCSLLCICSCSLYQVDSEYLTLEFYPPKPSVNQVVYLETVHRPYTMIGTVTVNAERRQKMSNILERMKRETAILGGDAITNIRTNAGTGKWAKIKPRELFGNANVRANYLADVIVFEDKTTSSP